MNKKKLSIIPILIVLFFILSSCGKSSHVSNLTINTSYDQWIEQINLFSRDNLKVSGYKEENNRIELELEYANGLAGYAELCDVVNAHNRFVEDNPNYFSEDIVICLVDRHASQQSIAFFSNDGSRYAEAEDYLEELGRTSTSKIQYMYIDMQSATDEIQESDSIKIDVPVIILHSGESYIPEGKAYAFLKEFNYPEQVILDFWEEGYNRDKTCKDIRDYLPDVEIYAVTYSSGGENLEKCP